MKYYGYITTPIDFWNGWTLFDDHIAGLVRRIRAGDVQESVAAADELGTAYAMLSSARWLAACLGWKGDMREGPYISGIPVSDGAGSCMALAFKQDQGGWTYVASDGPLPWLEGSNQKIVSEN